jgi:hypothetical protein
MDIIFSSLPDGLILLDGSLGQELINRKACLAVMVNRGFGCCEPAKW